MSFKDLTARAAAAQKPKPEGTAKESPDTEAPEAGSKRPAPEKP